MKRLILILILSLFVASCVGLQTQEKITFMVFGDLAELEAYRKLVKVYEDGHPETRIELIHIPDQADYRKRLAADFAAGSPADVVLLNYRRIGPYASKGALEPLGPYLDKSDVISVEDFYPEAIQPFKWQGQVLCIPQNLSSLVVYYNKNLFDQTGLSYPEKDWTWDEFLAAAQALTRDLDGDNRPDQHGLGIEVSLARFAPFMWQNGGEVVNNTFAPVRLTLDMPQSLDAIAWLVALQTEHHVVPDAEQEAAEDSESRFMNGRLAMYLNSRRGVPTYRQITAFDWDIAPLPSRVRPASLVHSDAYCMPASVKQKDLVWKFIEFANSIEGQTIVAASGRTVPSLKSVAKSSAFLDPQQKPLNSQVFLDMIPHLRALPSTAGWVDAEELATAELQRAFYGQASLEEVIPSAIMLAQPYLGEAGEP